LRQRRNQNEEATMDRSQDDRTPVDGNREAAAQGRLNMQPGRLEDIENATAYANRTGQRDVAGHQTGTGGGASRVNPGEDLGNGMEAKPADGLEGRDGRITPGEEIGSGIRARAAGDQDVGNPLV
jgi:hypothetical protein